MVIPIIVKLLISLVAIITLNSFSKNLTLSLLGGSLVFAFWVGLGPADSFSIAAERVFSYSNLTLICLVCLVIILSGQMKKNKMVEELVASIRGTFSSRASLGILPAVIGLLPMPGGALFSAPLLDNFDDLSGVNQETKTRINYWFRHVWEYTWPLYPGIILCSDISGIPLWMFFIAGMPVTIVVILLGKVIFLSNIPRETKEIKQSRNSNRYFSIVPFIPIISVVAIYFSIQFLVPAVAETNQYLPMVTSLVISILLLQVIRPLKLKDWKSLLFSRRLFSMAMLIVMIRIYGAFIEADIEGITVVQRMTEEMQSFGIPSLPLVILLPFIAGLTMGVSVGFVGASMPVVVAMLGTNVPTDILLSTIILAYISGFMGTMLSPLHVCLIVTCDYYESSFIKSLRSIIFPAVILIVFGYLYMQFLQFLL